MKTPTVLAIDFESLRLKTHPGTPERALVDTMISDLDQVEDRTERTPIKSPPGLRVPTRSIREYTNCDGREVRRRFFRD